MKKWLFILMLSLVSLGAHAQPSDSLVQVRVQELSDSLALLRTEQAQLRQVLDEVSTVSDSNETLAWVIGCVGALLVLVGGMMVGKAEKIMRSIKRQAQDLQPAAGELDLLAQQLSELKAKFQELKAALEQQRARDGQPAERKSEPIYEPSAEVSGSKPSSQEEPGKAESPAEVANEASVGEATAYLQKPLPDGRFMPYKAERSHASYFSMDVAQLRFQLIAEPEIFDRMRQMGLTSILTDAVAQLQEGSLEHWKRIETVQPGLLMKQSDGTLLVVEKLVYRTV